jgi:hypothetical protein
MRPGGERIIELSKVKLGLLLLGAVGFVAMGCWMFTLDDAEILAQRRFNNPLLVHGIGILAATFFGLCGVIAVIKLFDSKPGLVLNDAGLVDNASGIAAGFIPWSDVSNVGIYEIQKQKMLVIQLTDTSKYIARGSAFRRMVNRANTSLCGSPVAIPSSALKIRFDDLVVAFDEYRDKMGVPPATEHR